MSAPWTSRLIRRSLPEGVSSTPPGGASGDVSSRTTIACPVLPALGFAASPVTGSSDVDQESVPAGASSGILWTPAGTGTEASDTAGAGATGAASAPVAGTAGDTGSTGTGTKATSVAPPVGSGSAAAMVSAPP